MNPGEFNSSAADDVDVDSIPDFNDIVEGGEPASPPAEAGNQSMSETPATPTASEPQRTQPAQPTPQAAPVSPQPAVATQPSASTTQPQPAPQPAVQQPPTQPGPSMEQMRAENLARREATLATLRQSYALTQEQKDAIALSPEDALANLLPEMAAQTALTQFEYTYSAIVQQLPNMVAQVYQQIRHQEKAQEENDREFFSMWPQLKADDATHQTVIREVATLWAKARGGLNDPSMKAAFFQEVGALAALRLGLAVTPNVTPAKPAAPAQPTTPARPFTPHRPVAAGSHPVAQPAVRSGDNPFQDLIDHQLGI